MNKILLCMGFLLCLLVCSCSKAPVVTIQNDSLVKITSICLKGTGFLETIPSLEPGKSVSVTVHPRGGSSLEIQFLTPEGEKKMSNLAYIDSARGYKVIVRINEKLEINAKSGIRE